MPKFEIEKNIICNLIVECRDEDEARMWANKVVAFVEDETGNMINSGAFESFEASATVSDIKILMIE